MSESIGQRLKKERESRYLTLEKVSEDTRIRIVILRAFEADDHSALPSVAQGRGFLRNYAAYLGLNLDEMIAKIQKSAPPPDMSGPLPQVNLAETESSIIENEDENPARPFWASWFGRRAQVDLIPEPEPVLHEEGAEIESESKTPPVEEEQTEVEDEAKPGFIARLISIFQFRITKPESEFTPTYDLEKEEPAPVVELKTPVLPADKIFVEIGTQIRERRELISLTVEEVERHTKLRASFIKALEAGTYDKLPSPVQTRGMLANYAAFLDIDADTILLRFADGLQARRHEKYAEIPREKIQTQVNPSMPFLRSFIAGDLVFGVAMIVVLIALAVWGVGRVVSSQEAKNAAPAAPLIVDVIGDDLPTESVAVTSLPVDERLTTPTVDALFALDAPLTVESTANVVVSVFALERVFVRISADGKLVFEGRLAPREIKIFEATNQVVILTGNAAALRVTYNGRDLGLMGNVGEVVSRVYLVTGIATPTATISRTPTNTLPATMTPTPTLTPTFTPPSE